MHLTENGIEALFWAFILGAAAGSIVTYYITTREKRVIANVRDYINIIGTWLVAKGHLDENKYRKALNSSAELVSDKKILEIHSWAERFTKDQKLKTDAVRLTAAVIICETLLGLPYGQAVKAGRHAKYLEEMFTLLLPKAPAEVT
jgi:hypothetical protein